LWISFCLDALDDVDAEAEDGDGEDEEKSPIPISILQRASIIAADSKLGLRYNMLR
jgi:hypothetical protein